MGMFSKQNESGEEELPQGSSKSNHCFRLTGVKSSKALLGLQRVSEPGLMVSWFVRFFALGADHESIFTISHKIPRSLPALDKPSSLKGALLGPHFLKMFAVMKS